MKRMVWGIVLVVTGLTAILGMLTNRGQTVDPGAVVLSVLMLGGGAVMISFGVKGEQQKERIMDAALVAWRTQGRIDSIGIATTCRVPATRVRQLLAREQTVGVLPKEALVDEPRAVAVQAGGAL
ncbi:MAG: hypothetical protein J0L64_02310 [Acidobacteria bacterium]|nr:hypothetical protein [Acidobacteriota bacterium]